MDNSIRYLEVQRIIDINKKIIETWNPRHSDKPERFDVNIDRIVEILEIVKNVANELDREKALIEKAAYLMGGLSWNQPFSGANKRTSILSGILFFAENGYQPNMPQKENPELRQMLFDIQGARNEIDRAIITKLVLYITKFLTST